MLTKPPNLESALLLVATPAMSAVKVVLDLKRSSPQYRAASKAVPATEVVVATTAFGGIFPAIPVTANVPSGLLSVTFNPVAVPSDSMRNS